jgi:hypothetical protein
LALSQTEKRHSDGVQDGDPSGCAVCGTRTHQGNGLALATAFVFILEPCIDACHTGISGGLAPSRLPSARPYPGPVAFHLSLHDFDTSPWISSPGCIAPVMLEQVSSLV